LAGRIDDSAHDVAAAKVSDVSPHAQEIQQHLRDILASPSFQSSRRCQEFLAYVVEHALSGDFGGLKERVLGIRIFSRNPNYNTSDDSIVRVTASEVRKRLLQYYKSAEPSSFRIELQSGSYIPEFLVTSEATRPKLEPARLAPVTSIEAGVPAVVATVTPEPSPDAPASKPHAWRWIFAVCVALLATFAAGWALARFHGNPVAPVAADRSPYGFYQELLGPLATDPHRATYIVLSNPVLYLYRGAASPAKNSNQDGWEQEVPITQALADQLKSRATDFKADPGVPFLALDTMDYTGLGEAKTAFHLATLFDALGRSPSLTEARFLNWEQAQDQHLVFLGAPHMSPWIQKNLAPVAFTMDHDVIRNLHPLPGEQAVYARAFHGAELEDYGLIWMSRSPSGSQMLVLAGLTSTGTAGVGSFFSDPAQMRPVFERLRSESPNHQMPNNWQVLLRIDARDKVPLHVSFVSLRTGSSK
jgi:hypothetical protein